ncbi:hypothetical protein TSUD_41290 [Trifolium subterraneum]|nr:hypothetical protein TSUD_41290 [Trifolium subterraneum]
MTTNSTTPLSATVNHHSDHYRSTLLHPPLIINMTTIDYRFDQHQSSLRPPTTLVHNQSQLQL